MSTTHENPGLLLVTATAELEPPSASEEKLLRALDQVTRALILFDEQFILEVQRQREARRVLHVGDDPLPLKSTEQSQIEEKRRAAKRIMSDVLDRLCEGRMYDRAQILSAARDDGSFSIRNPMQQAIASADVREAMAYLENSYARRAFWLRYKDGRDDHHIARVLGTTPDAVSRLCNIALDEVDVRLNEPVVASVRARFFGFILQHGLEFPEYAQYRKG